MKSRPMNVSLGTAWKGTLTCSNELHHFDTTAITIRCIGHIFLVNCVVERIVASRIVPRVAFKTFYRHARWKYVRKTLLFPTMNRMLHQHEGSKQLLVRSVGPLGRLWVLVEEQTPDSLVVAHNIVTTSRAKQWQTFGYYPSSSLV